MRKSIGALAFWLCAAGPSAQAADLRGHGGPVRAISLAPDDDSAVTGSFDSTAILWSLSRSAALKVLRGHDGAVNAALALGNGRYATGGEDGKIAFWQSGQDQPTRTLAGHSGPIAALAASQDRSLIASASWDGTARVWTTEGQAALVLGGHTGNVNGVGFLADGSVVTASYDGAVRIFDRTGAILRSYNLGVALNALAVAPGDEIVIVAADGTIRFVDRSSGLKFTVEASQFPLVTLAVSADGLLVGVAGFRGALVLVNRESRAIVRRLEGPAFPLWSLAFTQDGTEVLTGGSDRLVRRWSVATGEPTSAVVTAGSEDVPVRLKDHPGAEVFKACVACHTLTIDGGVRAGPTLAGLYGRRIGSVPGYDFSPALRSLPIIWTPETVQQLFEIGPAAFTPGTKMPEQKIIRADERKALTDFLELATAR